MQVQKNLLFVALVLIEYIFSAVNECSPNPFVEPFPRIKMFVFYYQHEQMNSYLPQTLPKLPVGCEKTPFPSNPVPYSKYLYLSTSAFSVNLTAPNKQFSKVKSAL